MDWIKKPKATEEPVFTPTPVVEEPPFNLPQVKTDLTCEVDGCYEPKAPGQNHVCLRHQRAS